MTTLPFRNAERSTVIGRSAPVPRCALLILCSCLLPFNTSARSPQKTEIKPDPCALLTEAEIEGVQGEKVTDTTRSEPERRLFAVSQCFYTLATFSKSISLEVTRKDPGRTSAPSPRDHWKQIFHASSERAAREPGEEEAGPVQPVPDVGDEAFWTSSGMGGALYVLKGDAYLRISLGGPDDPEVRLEKSKALARKALARI